MHNSIGEYIEEVDDESLVGKKRPLKIASDSIPEFQSSKRAPVDKQLVDDFILQISIYLID